MSALAYVTLEEAKRQLQIAPADTFHDEHILLLIGAASGAVKNYLKDFSAYEGQRNADDDYIVDSNGEPVLEPDGDVKSEVKMSVLILVAEWFKNREGEGAEYEQFSLPRPVKALLYPLRDPALR